MSDQPDTIIEAEFREIPPLEPPPVDEVPPVLHIKTERLDPQPLKVDQLSRGHGETIRIPDELRHGRNLDIPWSATRAAITVEQGRTLTDTALANLRGAKRPTLVQRIGRWRRKGEGE